MTGREQTRQTVTARCVVCHNEREIGPNEVAKSDVPMCDKCFAPMVAVRAQSESR